jgi:hypothetical protein
MAAGQPVTNANTEFTGLFDGPPHRSSTTEPPKPTTSLLMPSPPSLTDISKSEGTRTLFVGGGASGETAQRLPNEPGLQVVSAVIDEIMRDSVLVRCLLPDGTLDLRLPPSLIPADLLNFGQPVTISLLARDGIRAPLIQRRDIPAQLEFSDQNEIDSWIESI